MFSLVSTVAPRPRYDGLMAGGMSCREVLTKWDKKKAKVQVPYSFVLGFWLNVDC